jgi:hypothetical protein
MTMTLDLPMKAALGVIATLLLACGGIYWRGEYQLARAEKRAAEAKAELAALQTSLSRAESDIKTAQVEAARTAQAEKERRDAETLQFGIAAARAIATAKSAGPDEVDPDSPLSLSVSDALRLQYDKICASGACGVTEPGQIRAPADTRAAVEGGPAGNAAPDRNGL